MSFSVTFTDITVTIAKPLLMSQEITCNKSESTRCLYNIIKTPIDRVNTVGVCITL